MAKHPSSDTRAEAVALYQAGVPAPEVAARLGIGSSTIYRWLNAAGIVPADLIAAGERAKFGGASAEQAERMEALYLEGRSLREVAEQSSVSPNVVHRILQQRGVEIRGRGATAQPIIGDNRDRVISLWESGEAIDAIVNQVGAGRDRVKQCLRAAGYEPEIRIRRGERHASWKEGAFVTANGYRFLIVRDGEPFTQMRNSLGYVAEHRLVMARSLGRPLAEHETVHHLNGVRDDNRLENLQLRSGRHGKGAAFRCRACGSHDVEAVSIAEARPD